jgi:uncharacterized MAPEG superfamily protein
MSLSSILPSFDAFACVGGLALLAYVPHALKVYYVTKSTGKYGTRNPRETVKKAIEQIGDKPEAKLIARLDSCHANHLEHFPIVAACVLMATVSGVDRATVNFVATQIALSRVLHFLFYFGDLHGLRPLAFFATLVLDGYLFVKAAAAHQKH